MLYSNWTFALSWAWASHASKEVKDGKTEPDQISRQRGSGMAHHMRILDVWRVMAMVRPPAVHHGPTARAWYSTSQLSVSLKLPSRSWDAAWCINVQYGSVWLHRNYALQNHITPCEWCGMKCNTNVRSSESYSGSFMSLETIETKWKQLLKTLKGIEHVMKIARIGPCPARGASHSNWPWRFPHHNCHNCHNFGESRKVQVPRCSELHSWKQHVNFSGTVQSRI